MGIMSNEEKRRKLILDEIVRPLREMLEKKEENGEEDITDVITEYKRLGDKYNLCRNEKRKVITIILMHDSKIYTKFYCAVLNGGVPSREEPSDGEER